MASESVVNENLYAILESRFPSDRYKPFLTLHDGKRCGLSFSYADLDAISARIAAVLVEAGAGRGDRVAVQVEKSPENLLLYFAVLRIGAAFLPLNVAYQQAEIAYFLDDAEPRLIICRPEDEAMMQTLTRGRADVRIFTLGVDGDGSLMQAALHQKDHFDTAMMQADDLAAILYTSGTTGRSKGAMTSHGNLSSNALTLHDLWGFRSDDVLLHALPIFHVHGLFVATHLALLCGGSMVFLSRFDAERVIALLPLATVMMGVPTFYTRLLAHPGLNRALVARMRLFISGSAPLLAETHHAFAERSGHAILERYGMTEGGMIASNPLLGERMPGAVGFALPGVGLRIADAQGRPLPQGSIGVIEFKGPNLFKGYWRQPDKTAEDMRPDGFFITGDMGLIDERGFLRIVGRTKDLIICGGYNVYPKEIETEIDALQGVAESAVIGLPHPDFGEAVAAIVQRNPGRAEPTEEAVIAYVRSRLAHFKVPKRVWFVDELPRNQMGKVQKAHLRALHASAFQETCGT
jgi:malonyl-CoA/methylmalonyl-CoA synthetase